MTAKAKIAIGDCREIMRQLPDNYFSAIITDPPYEWGFMSKKWDGSGIAYDVEMWAECLRVLKPGGHLLSFGGKRTYHRMACAVEDAGFEIRESISWLYSSGFPKGQDISKAIDKLAGATREVVGTVRKLDSFITKDAILGGGPDHEGLMAIIASATPEVAQWEGWGTQLKPASESIVVAQKPRSEKTIAKNVLKWGTGGLNIDATRIGTMEDTRRNARDGDNGLCGEGTFRIRERRADDKVQPSGRFPADVVLSHGADCVEGADCTDGCPVAELDAQSGQSKSLRSVRLQPGAIIGNENTHGKFVSDRQNVGGFNDSGGASRFFPVFRYQAKAPTRERPKVNDVAHATVKPLELMRWLVRLVCPPDGIILDPFAGSGTTLQAATLEGFRVLGIEMEESYLPLIQQRLPAVKLWRPRVAPKA